MMVLVLVLATGLLISYAPGPYKLLGLLPFALLMFGVGDDRTHPRV